METVNSKEWVFKLLSTGALLIVFIQFTTGIHRSAVKANKRKTKNVSLASEQNRT